MSVHDPIHWSVHLTSYSRDENLGRIHWLSLRSHVVFLHSRLTGCIPAAATTTKKKREELLLEFNLQLNECVACIHLEIRNTKKRLEFFRRLLIQIGKTSHMIFYIYIY